MFYEIMSGHDFDKPVLQRIGIQRIPSVGENADYRLYVSDGKYFIS